MEVTARLQNLRIAPRKVRLVADLIRGKKLDEAQTILNFTTKNLFIRLASPGWARHSLGHFALGRFVAYGSSQ